MMVQTSTTFGFKDTGIKKSEFVANAKNSIPSSGFKITNYVFSKYPHDDDIFR